MDGPLPLHPQGSTTIALGAVAVGVRDVAEGAWRRPRFFFGNKKGQVSRKSGKIHGKMGVELGQFQVHVQL